MEPRMLSKADELTSTDQEVTREDQDKINRFSRLHTRETALEEELRVKLKDKEDLEEVETEIMLAEEDDLISYKIGDSFISLSVSEVQELLTESTESITNDVDGLKEKLEKMREEMEGLKVDLYGRFGKSINLETS